MTTTIEEHSNLTRSQLLIWMGQRLDPSVPLYNMALSFALPFEVDAPAFRQAVDECIGASEALRTTFSDSPDGPMQAVSQHIPRTTEYIDLSESRHSKHFSEWANERCRRSFNLGECLYDSVLIRLGPQQFFWFLNKHHLITDAWSMATFYRQVSDRYVAIKTQPQVRPTECVLAMYSDYLRYELSQRNVVADHWRQRTVETEIAKGLYGRPSQAPSSQTNRITRRISGPLAERLHTTARASPFRAFTEHLSRFNLFATLLIAWQHRVTGESQVTLGTPSHNRPAASDKATIGLMMELLPLQVAVGPDETFASLSKKVHQETGQFLRHARAGSTNADLVRAFNVVLNYITVSFPEFAGHEATAEWHHPGYGDRAHHLRLQIHDFDGTGDFQLHFDINSDLYDDDQQKTAADHFLIMLDAMLADCNQPIEGIRLQSAEPKRATVGAINGHQQTIRSVLQRFETHVQQNPQTIAIVDGTNQWEFQEVDSLAEQLADSLRSSGVEPGDRVVLLLPRSATAVAVMLAVWKCQAAFTPIDISNPSARIDFIIDDLAPAAVVATSSTAQLTSCSAAMVVVEPPSPNIIKGTTKTPSQKKRVADTATAYVLYTSGSTGAPKGVVISQAAIANYVDWACRTYGANQDLVFPLFTSLSFDLTLTSILIPLASGGRIVVYPESSDPADITLLDVVHDNQVNIIKLTPSHLNLLRNQQMKHSGVEQLIVGGEDLKTELANSIAGQFGNPVVIHNEYGPTEATIGCVLRTFDPATDTNMSVPIGLAIDEMETWVLNDQLAEVPDGMMGELYLSGIGLADEYWARPELSEERFLPNPLRAGTTMYRTGDLVRRSAGGILTYIGRTDGQIKVRGVRVETGEIEAALQSHPKISGSFVGLQPIAPEQDDTELKHCVNCGLPSNYPDVTFDHIGQCSHCIAFDQWKHKAEPYFRTMEDLHGVFHASRSENTKYDCMSLLSGGKDSTFALCQLVDMGLNVLAFTLDNGYLSDEAKHNIDRVVEALGVDHLYGSTPAMNAIFVDSLKRHGNVCQGCFKTVYTLSMQEAQQRGIRHIVTGLSRGQLFETRLSEDLFHQTDSALQIIDSTILEARKAYHRVNDAVRQNLNTEIFDDNTIFEELNFIDFYRYCDVSLSEMMSYLKERVGWVRPADTGRSTNCLINDVGIHIHKQTRGFHNYAFPYSWDVRMGHKTRSEAMEELDDEIEFERIETILKEIGYVDDAQPEPNRRELLAWYVADESLSEAAVRQHISQTVPAQMMPSRFVRISDLPMTINGKLDQTQLPLPGTETLIAANDSDSPELTELEEIVIGIWRDALQTPAVALHDNFFEIGGDSLLAMSVVARINQTFEIELPISRLFDASTVAKLSALLEQVLLNEICGDLQ